MVVFLQWMVVGQQGIREIGRCDYKGDENGKDYYV